MLKAISKRLKNNKGFTLVELIVVLSVLGIISAIAVPRFTGIQEEAKKKADIATARSLAKATELALVQGDVSLDDEDVDIEDALVNKGYLDSKPEPQYNKDSNFTVEVDDKGKITVKVGNDELYPEVDSDYQ